MTDDNQGFSAPPIKGYQDVSGDKQAVVNANKEIEERLLRRIDELSKNDNGAFLVDQRWLAIGRTKVEEAFMAINRAIFQPQRIKLPEDDASP